MIFDRISWMNQDIEIIGSLIVGIIITLISLMRLNKIIDEKKEKSELNYISCFNVDFLLSINLPGLIILSCTEF
jgi:hypothetical protein